MRMRNRALRFTWLAVLVVAALSGYALRATAQ
jgi:hypothetical protein